MLDESDFLSWCRKLNLTGQAQAAVRQIRESAPSRRVESRRGNVSGRYPSRKMGVTIQFESHKNELAHIRELEHDLQVLEFYDQPHAIKLDYRSTRGRRLGVLHTPDFFVLRETDAGWEECKTEEELTQLAAKNPNRYRRAVAGEGWHAQPGEAYAAQFGFYYRVCSSAQINWTWQRNIEFLDDYLRASKTPSNAAHLAFVRALLNLHSPLMLAEVFHLAESSVSRDEIYLMIARGEVYTDLRACPLVEPECARIFTDEATARSEANFLPVEKRANAPAHPSRVVSVETGKHLLWDGQTWQIINIGDRMIALHGEAEAFTELPHATFERLVVEARISNVPEVSDSEAASQAKAQLAAADCACLAEANRRAQIVRRYLREGKTPEVRATPTRTLQRWVRSYRQSQEACGNGYVGLVPRPRAGNNRDKLPPATKLLLAEFIEHDYETLKQKRRFEVYAAFVEACRERGIITASYKTFCRAVRARPRYEQTRKRQGQRAAYRYEPWHWELTLTTPRHGERPFQIAHLDHTELDAELVCSVTGQPLGRPWATFMTDAYSRRVLALYLTFDPPSYRSCMMVLREGVRRFNRLPQTIVVDGGAEFGSIYFESLLARYECTKKTRPAAHARFGSVCERLFGTANSQFIHNLAGNTQIMRQVREVTKACSPRTHAVWTLGELHRYLCQWAYEVYDMTVHPALGQSPREAFTQGLRHGGERAHRLIVYDEDFRISTLPTTAKGTAKVAPGRGVKINHLYYWAEAFRSPSIESLPVAVRFDPTDVGTAYAFVGRRWVTCYSEHYAVFRGRSERELMLASAELRARRKQHGKQVSLGAARLARFLQSVEAEETLLRQRLADREAQGLRQTSVNTSVTEANVTDDEAGSSTTDEAALLSLELYGEFV